MAAGIALKRSAKKRYKSSVTRSEPACNSKTAACVSAPEIGVCRQGLLGASEACPVRECDSDVKLSGVRTAVTIAHAYRDGAVMLYDSGSLSSDGHTLCQICRPTGHFYYRHNGSAC